MRPANRCGAFCSRQLAAAVALLAAASCGSSTETFVGPSQTRCAVQAQTETGSFPSSGGEGLLRITVNRDCEWTVQSDASWLALPQGPKGQGAASVRFVVAANGDPASRSARLAVNDQGLQISQQGTPCVFRLSSTRETVAASGEQRRVHVESSSAQCQWTAAADVPWISLVGSQTRSGSADVVFDVEAVTGPPRIGTLTIAGQTVEVEQGTGCTYATAVTALNVGSAGGTSEVPVTAPSGCAWRATSQAPWIAILEGQSGSGPGRTRIRVDATNGPTRTGTLVVAERTVTVTQSSGCAVEVEPASQSAPATGGTRTITVQAAGGCAWTASSQVPWIVVTAGTSGTGSGQVQFSVAANTGPARTGSLTVGPQSVLLSQPSGCSFSVTPGSVDLSGTAQTGTVSVSTAAGCRWTAATQAAWITLPLTSGLGPAQISFSVPANNGPRRSAVLGIEGNPVAVAQSSLCTWTVFPVPYYDMAAAGGRGFIYVSVDGPCTWSASTATSWITLEAGTSGTGTGVIQFVTTPNAGPERQGIVTIAGIDYRVVQLAR